MEDKYSINDFIYWLEKYNYDGKSKEKFTQGQIASMIGKAMINFFDDSETDY